MSTPITVFVPEGAPAWTPPELNARLATHGFHIHVEDFDPVTQAGFLPASYDHHPSGFEYFRDPIEDYQSAIEDLREEEPDEFPYSNEDLARVAGCREVIQLVTHAVYRERATAIIVAAVLAELTGGWVLDEPVWQWHDATSAVSWACVSVEKLEPLFSEDPY